MDYIYKFISDMAQNGIEIDEQIIADGQIHRFHIKGDSPGSKNGWYIFFSDSIPSGAYGCWKRDIHKNWSSKSANELSESERKELNSKIKLAKEKQLIEKNTDQEKAKENATQIWSEAETANNKHPYLIKKMIPAINIRVTQNGSLIIPIYDKQDQLCSLQFIATNGNKIFLKKGSLKGNYFLLGELTDVVYIVEGYATGVSIFLAMNCGVFITFNANNLLPATQNIRKRYPNLKIILAGDEDKWPNKSGVIFNKGRIQAEKTARLIHCDVVFPVFPKCEKESTPTDWNDLMMISGLDEVKNQLQKFNEGIMKTPPHSEILNSLLERINPIDFRARANIASDKHIMNCHFLILVVEEILELAQLNNWGICRNYDFIYLFNGTHWSLISEEELKIFLSKAAEKMGVDKFKAKHFNFQDQLYKQFIALANLPKPKPEQNSVLINLKNGTFVITPEETALRTFNRADFLTYQLPFEYNPNADAPQFFSYLHTVMPDIDRQMILAEYLGYVFVNTATLKLEKALLLYGTGANGKSVFYEIVRKLLGEQNISEYSLQSLTNENGYYRAMIANKLANYASEINGKLESSIFKQLVSGEPVEARLPYGNPFTLTQYAKLLFNCNELPRDVEHTEAYFRRFLIVPFEIVIPEEKQDKQLAQKIIANELSGIFNWVLDGLKRILQQKKFTDSEKVQQIREQYQRESDSVRQFLHESSCKPNTTRYVLLKDLFYEYRLFCEEDGFKPVNKTNFKKRLEHAKFIVERKNIGIAVYATKHD